MDIYTWLVYRMFTLNVASGRGGKRMAQVPWIGLMQFGTGYSNTPQGLLDFKKAFRKRLKEALLFYPEAARHVEERDDYVLLTPAKLHIAPRM